jgi:hypothetical protein
MLAASVLMVLIGGVLEQLMFVYIGVACGFVLAPAVCAFMVSQDVVIDGDEWSVIIERTDCLCMRKARRVHPLGSVRCASVQRTTLRGREKTQLMLEQFSGQSIALTLFCDVYNNEWKEQAVESINAFLERISVAQEC